MGDGSDPDVLFKLKIENRIRKSPQHVLMEAFIAVRRKRTWHACDALYGTFNLLPEFVPQTGALLLIIGDRGTQLRLGFTVENNGLHGRWFRSSANNCSAGLPTA